MSAVRAFINGITWLNDHVGRWVSYLVFAMFAFLILEVFLRYVFGAPTVWTNELTQMLFGIYGVLAGGYVMAHKGHVNVDLFHSALPVRVRAGLDVITSAVFFIFVGALLYFGSSMALESIEGLETSYSAWTPPIWPIKACIPLGALLLLLQGLAKLLQDLGVAFNLIDPSEIKTLGDEEEDHL